MNNQKKRRSRGSGSIAKQRDTYYYLWIDTTGRRRKKSLRTKDKREAEKRAKEFEDAVNARDKEEVLLQSARARKVISRQELPLKKVWQEFINTRPTASEGTQKNYKRHLQEFLDWLESNHPETGSFTEITPEIAREYLQSVWQSGVSANTYNYKKNSLGLITKNLASKYGIETNPWTDPNLRAREVKQKRLPLTSAQIENLLKKLEDPETKLPCGQEGKAAIKMCLFAGTRLIDAVKMRWHNIDLEAGKMTYTPRKTATKGKEAQVPLLPPLYNELKDLNRESEYLFPNLASHYDKNSDYVHKRIVKLIHSVTGDGRERNEVSGQRQVNRSAYGAHSLRATFATQAAMAGCKAVWLSLMLGDALNTVDKYYINAGWGDNLTAGFTSLPTLTENRTTDNPRERLKLLADELPIDKVEDLVKSLS